MMDYRYVLVDVFTEHPLEGNALAVFPDARGLDDRTMQSIAREMNLSETTFVLPPTTADSAAIVRIFTPQKEMVFAGHPTIGTSFVLWRERPADQRMSCFVLEERVGRVGVRIDQGGADGAQDNPLIWLRTPPIQFGRTFEADVCARVIGLERDDCLDLTPQLLSAGNPTLFIALRDERAVDNASLDSDQFRQLKRGMGASHEPFCVFAFAPTRHGAYSRMFAPDYGIPEDPATGSSTGPLAAYMIRHGLASTGDQTRFVSEQGTKIGRRSLLHVLIHGEDGGAGIDVGGHVTPVAEGRLSI